MSCNSEIHENDIGTEFIVTITECVDGIDVPLDISSATDKEIVFSTGGTATTFTAIFTSIASGGAGDGTDGKISYFSILGDLTPSGTYKIQGIVTTPAGKWYSTIEKFKVVSNL